MLSIPNEPLIQAKIEKLRGLLEEYGLLDLLTLYGFLSAIVSGPNPIMPNEWLDFLRLNKIKYESIDEAQENIGFIMAIYNNITQEFQNKTFQIIPPALNDRKNPDLSTAKNLWVHGYMLGVAYDKGSWLINDEMVTLLFSMTSLRIDAEFLQQLIDRNGANLQSQKIREYSEDKLSEAANAIYQYWLKRRNPATSISRIQARKFIAVGRNDPCSCGSGKKFKKCCLH